MSQEEVNELESYIQYLQWKITNLKIEENAPVPVSGDVIPAGSVFYCRPSNLGELVERLGGIQNVQIMDTDDTKGFSSSKSFTPKPWTNEVYPTDIGPSCNGIDSDTSRLPVKVNNECITPSNWDPLKMFKSDKGIQSRTAFSWCFTAQRVLWIHESPINMWSFLFKYKSSVLNNWGMVHDPSFSGMRFFPSDAFEKEMTTYVFTLGQSQWEGNEFISITVVNDIAELAYYLNDSVGIRNNEFSTVVWPDNEVCLVEQFDYTTGGLILTPMMPAQNLPFRVNLFHIDSNRLEKAQATDTLRYGGYNRKEAKSTGPTPIWGRTNIIQIKTIRDVAVSIRSQDDVSELRRRNKLH